MRCAADFGRGLIPTVYANMKTAADLCPASSSRLQRRQYRFSKTPPARQEEILSSRLEDGKYAEGFPHLSARSLSKATRTKLGSSQMRTESCTLQLCAPVL